MMTASKDRHSKHGRLLVIEGIDGTGKTTFSRNLYERLQKMGIPVILTFEPTMGTYGRRLRDSFSRASRLDAKEELELFLKDRKEHVSNLIRPALEQGKFIVCDRYYFSTIAYQGARGIDPDHIRKINEAIAPVPDVVFLLELAPEEALCRIRHGRNQVPNSFERLDYLRKVDTIFRLLKDPFIVRLDASQPQGRLVDEAIERLSASPFDFISNTV